MKLKKYIAFALCFFTFQLMADEELTRDAPIPTKFIPWFTGPLLAPSGATVPPGEANIEPYIYFTTVNGRYNENWNVSSRENFYSARLQIQTKVGIIKGLEFQIFPQAYYKFTQGAHSANIGDLPFAIGIQILRSKVENWWPFIKLSLRVNAPIGKYEHLSESKKNTDAMGSGSWSPSATLTFSKLFEISPVHYLESRLAFSYQIGTAVHVRGFNTYGGASNTDGIAYPGNIFLTTASIQYNFTQSWVFACDFQYEHRNKNRFSGFAGTDSDGEEADMTNPSTEQFSLAPAIEYNWSKNVGLIGGVWFTLAGRNSSRFVSGVIALNIHIG